MLDELHAIEKSKIVGLVLDISLKHVQEGRRVDIVKTAVRDACLACLRPADPVYICTDADIDGIPPNRDAGLARMANFEVPVTFEAGPILNHTVDKVGETDYDGKYVIYVTDRYKEVKKFAITSSMNTDLRKEYGCRFLLVSIGGKYSSAMNDLLDAEHPRCWLSQVTDLSLLRPFLENFLTEEDDDRAECSQEEGLEE